MANLIYYLRICYMKLKLDQFNKNAQNWTQIDWAAARINLAGLQYEILKAYKSDNKTEVRHAQNNLVRNFSARCLAVRKVTSNKGKNTHGSDGVLIDNIYEDLEIHHILSKKDRGSDKLSNLLLLHKTCHKQITYSKDEHFKAVWRKQGIVKEL